MRVTTSERAESNAALVETVALAPLLDRVPAAADEAWELLGLALA
jgi:hypothetical protein